MKQIKRKIPYKVMSIFSSNSSIKKIVDVSLAQLVPVYSCGQEVPDSNLYPAFITIPLQKEKGLSRKNAHLKR